jgi:hypothetical protein
MIKENPAPIVTVVEAGDVVLIKDLTKVNRSIKASEVGDEEEEYPHMDVKTPRMSNATIARSLAQR